MTVTPPVDPAAQPGAAWDMIAVKWLGRTLTGGTSTGTMTIRADRVAPLLHDDPTMPVSILPNEITTPVTIVQLVDGGISRDYMYAAVNVPASDDPDILGSGFTYTASIRLGNGMSYGPFTFAVPYTQPGGVLWLNKIVNATPTPGEALPQITLAEFNTAVARIAALEAGGGGGNDPAAVKLTGDQTVAGVKTFNASPVVPDGSFTQAKTTGLATSLGLLATKASPTFTGTVTGVTKTHVGLGNVDNTADTAKVVAASQITTGTIANARLGTGTPSAGRYVDGGTGAWTVLPAAGGGSGANIRKALDDGTWPLDLIAGTSTNMLILYANLKNMEGALAYLNPPIGVRNDWMIYHGPTPIDVYPTVSAAVTSKTGLAVTYTATGTLTSGTTATYAWTFTGGGTATGAVVSHTYASPGSVTATVTQTDSNNLKATATATTTVSAAASFTSITADVFTTAAAGAAAVKARTSEPGGLGGTGMKPTQATGTLNVTGGQLTMSGDANLLYATATTNPYVAFDLISSGVDGVADARIIDNNAGQFLRVRFRTTSHGATIAWDGGGTYPSEELVPNDTWQAGDRVEAWYDTSVTTTYARVTRGATVIGTWSKVLTSPVPTTPLSGTGTTSAATTVTIDNLVVGRLT